MLQVIQAALGVLRRIEYSVSEPEPTTETLFFLRDVRGLSNRLDDCTIDEWRMGSVRSVLSPLDLHLVARCVEHVLEAPDWDTDAQRALDASQLTALQSLLQEYMGSKQAAVDWW